MTYAQCQKVYRRHECLATASTVAAVLSKSLNGTQNDDVSAITTPTKGKNVMNGNNQGGANSEQNN
jgi:hypothetical protein